MKFKKLISNSILKNIMIVLGILIVFAFFANPRFLFNKTVFYNFQSRDIQRGFRLFNGHPIFYGPEMTGGGNLPGPLYYFLISIALRFKGGWIGVWLMQYILASISAIIGAYYFWSKTSKIISLTWIIFFSTALFTSFYITQFLNVSSMLCFTVAALVFINKAFTEDDLEKRNRNFILACFTIGLGIQLHLSIICLIFALFFMQFFAFKLKLVPLPSRPVWLGLSAFMLPIIPYLTWLLFSKLGAQFGVPAFYAGATDQAFASNAYLLKLGMNEPWSKILIDSLKKIFITFPLPLFLLIAVQLLSRSKMKVAKFKPILICLIFAFVPYAFWYFSTQAYRYSMPFYLSLIFITMFFLNDIKDSSKKIMIFNSIALFVQIIISFFVLFYSPKINILGFLISNTAIVILITLFVFFIEKNRWKTGRGFILSLILALTLQNDQKYLHQSIGEFVGYMPNKSEWTDIWTTIFNQTGWSYEEAKNKIYYIDHHISQDPELFLRSFNYHKELQKILLSPDGFFVSYSYGNSSRNREGGLVKPQDWLLKQNLHLDIITALKNGEIRLGENISKLNLIIPFWVTNSNKIPKHFHNVGEGYQASEDDKRLAEVPEDQGIKKIGPNTFLFKWNESPDKNSFCSTGAIVNVIKKNKDYQINIKIIGSTISQMTPWVSPTWTQAWISPYLEIMCDTQIKRFIISESVGFRRKYTHNKWDPLFTGNNSIIGPFEKNINFSCNGPITFLRLGRKGSTVDKIRSVKELPPKSLEINLRTYKFI